MYLLEGVQLCQQSTDPWSNLSQGVVGQNGYTNGYNTSKSQYVNKDSNHVNNGVNNSNNGHMVEGPI